MNKKSDIIITIVVLFFMLFSFLSVVMCVIGIIHAFSNPTLTTTQNIIYTLFDMKGIYVLIGLVTTYILLVILGTD